MSVAPLSNTFDGGSNGASINAGNSGGTSGDAFDSVNVDGSWPTFDNAQFRGTLAMKFITNAVSAVRIAGRWTGLGSLTTDVWFRQYMYLPANPNSFFYCGGAHTAADLRSCNLQITSAGKVAMENAGGADGQILGTISVALNQWIRLEWRVRSATSNGQFEWRLFNTPDSVSWDDTNSTTTAVLGANTDQALFGNTDSGGSTSTTCWIDDIAISTSGWIGPTVSSAPSVNPDYTTFPKSLVRPGRAGGQPS